MRISKVKIPLQRPFSRPGLGIPLRMMAAGHIAGGFSYDNIENQVIRYNPSDADNPPTTSTAAYFNGTNWLEVVQSVATGAAFTVCFWRKSSATVTTTPFSVVDQSAADQYYEVVATATTLRWYAVSGATAPYAEITSITPNNGSYHFIAARESTSSLRNVWFDATKSSNSITGCVPTGIDGFAIGARDASTVAQHDIAHIDHVYIWDVALTDDQITWLYTNKPTLDDLETSTDANNPGTTNLVFAPPLNNTAPGKWVDLSDSELHLTENGAAKGVTFASASSQWAYVDSSPAIAGPLSVTCSFKSNAGSGAIFSFTDKDDGATILDLRIIVTGELEARTTISGALNSKATTTSVYNNNVWHWGAAVFAAAGASRTVQADTETVTESTPRILANNLDRLALAALGDSSPSNYLDGTVDSIGIWTTALSPDHRTFLRTGGIGGGPASYRDVISSQHANNPFLTNPSALKAWYTLDEAAGPTIVNVHNPGTYNLTAVNSPTFAQTGHVIEYPRWGNGTVTPTAEVEDRAMLFRSSATQYGYNNNAPFTAAGKTMAVWVRTSTAATQRFLWVGDKDADDVYYALGCSVAGNAILIRQASGGGADTTTGAAINDGLWHLLVAVVTATNNVDLYVDNNAAVNDTTSVAIASFDNVTIGSHGGPTKAGLYANAIIDDPMIFNALLTATDVGDLYNSRAGLTAADLVSGAETITSAEIPQYAWPLNSRRASGNTECIGSTGGLTLTLSGSPTSAEGIPAGRAVSGTVYSLPDLSGSGYHATQSDITKRPVLVKVGEYQGRDVYMLKFDGVNDYLSITIGTPESANNWSAIAVCYDSAGNGYLIDIQTGALILAPNHASGAYNDGSWRGSDLNATTIHTLSWLLEAAASGKTYKDGTAVDTGLTYGQKALGGTISLGSIQAGTSAFLTGQLGDFLIISGIIPVAQHNAVGREMALKYANASIPAWTTVT